MNRILTTCAALAAMTLTAAPALAQSPRHYPRGGPPPFEDPRVTPPPYPDQGQFRLKLGMFNPEGESDFWQDDNFANFTGDIEDFDDVTYGLDFAWSASRYVSVMLSLEHYESEVTQYYRPLGPEYPDLTDLGHLTQLEITPLTLGIVLYPAGRRAPIVPYLGVGGGLFWWEYSEVGDFCAFDDPTDPFSCVVVETGYASEGVSGGWYAVAGLDIPITPAWSIFGEAKWLSAKADLGDDLEGYGELDLSGISYMGGFAWKF